MELLSQFSTYVIEIDCLSILSGGPTLFVDDDDMNYSMRAPEYI